MKGRVPRYQVEPTLHELGMLFLHAAALCRKPHYDDGDKILAFTAEDAIEVAMGDIGIKPSNGLQHYVEVLSPVLQFIRKTERITVDKRLKKQAKFQIEHDLEKAMNEASSKIRQISTVGDFDE